MPTRFFYAKNREVYEAGGQLFLDENSPDRYRESRVAPWGLLLATSGPLEVTAVRKHLFSLLAEIRETGVPEGVAIKVERLMACNL